MADRHHKGSIAAILEALESGDMTVQQLIKATGRPESEVRNAVPHAILPMDKLGGARRAHIVDWIISEEPNRQNRRYLVALYRRGHGTNKPLPETKRRLASRDDEDGFPLRSPTEVNPQALTAYSSPFRLGDSMAAAGGRDD